MKTGNITLFTAIAAAAAFASSAQAAITSVLFSDDGGATYTDGTGTDYGLGNFVLGDALNVGGATGYFKQKFTDTRGFSAADVLTDGNILKGAQYVSTTVGAYKYQVTFDEAGTFYLLSENRTSFDPTSDGYTDTGVDIDFSAFSLTFSVWSQSCVGGYHYHPDELHWFRRTAGLGIPARPRTGDDEPLGSWRTGSAAPPPRISDRPACRQAGFRPTDRKFKPPRMCSGAVFLSPPFRAIPLTDGCLFDLSVI